MHTITVLGSGALNQKLLPGGFATVDPDGCVWHHRCINGKWEKFKGTLRRYLGIDTPPPTRIAQLPKGNTTHIPTQNTKVVITVYTKIHVALTPEQLQLFNGVCSARSYLDAVVYCENTDRFVNYRLNNTEGMMHYGDLIRLGVLEHTITLHGNPGRYLVMLNAYKNTVLSAYPTSCVRFTCDDEQYSLQSEPIPIGPTKSAVVMAIEIRDNEVLVRATENLTSSRPNPQSIWSSEYSGLARSAFEQL